MQLSGSPLSSDARIRPTCEHLDTQIRMGAADTNFERRPVSAAPIWILLSSGVREPLLLRLGAFQGHPFNRTGGTNLHPRVTPRRAS